MQLSRQGPGPRAQGPARAPKTARRLLSSLVCASLIHGLWSTAALAADAQLDVYAFDEAGAIDDLRVQLDDGQTQSQDPFGALTVRIPAGEHRLRLFRGETLIRELPLTTVEDEIAQLILNLPARGEPEISYESSTGGSLQAVVETPSGPPGLLEGQIISAEDGSPLAGARIFVSGTPIDVQTDAEGRYRIELPPGDYSLSVLAASFNAQTVSEIQVVSEQTTQRQVELTPTGLELPDFVVLEPFVEGSLAAFVEEKRTSSAVTDILGAEQISRAGDSDAAGALKRVTGLTLVDGKFIYVRGLGERYSSTLLNGAQVPSPDPTRRVVPLDLFPTEILNGIVVQKTYAADMPGEFGGGTVQLRTRGVPESFLLRASATIGFVDGTTGETGLSYRGGDRDWLGRDDGSRAAPSGLLVPPAELPSNRTPEGEALGEALAAKGYQTSPKKIDPNSGFSLSIGDDLQFSDGDWSLGYIAALRYAQNWDIREEERAFYALSGGQLFPQQQSERETTQRAVDTGLFTSVGLTVGEHHVVNATGMQVRQTTDEVQTDTGILGSGEFERLRSLEWIENELQVGQLNGEHSLPQLGNLVVGWQYTKAKASRESPNARDYRFSYNEDTDTFRFRIEGLEQRFETLSDDAEEFKLDLRWPYEVSETTGVTVLAGWSDLSKARDSIIQRFRWTTGPQFNSDNPEDFLNPDTIGTGLRDYRLTSRSQPTDAYTASVDLKAWYLALDGYWNDFRLYLGARQEEVLQEVRNVTPFDPNATPQIGIVDEKDLLPSASLTWAYSDTAQVRFAYGKSVARPDIREQSPASFIDPLLDLRVVGNPDLEQTSIENLDLRWEYYFSATESFSFALFQKDFTAPIELIESPASGTLLQIINAEAATNRGAEIDYYRSLDGIDGLPGSKWLGQAPWNWSEVFLGFNYAYIDSEIDLGDRGGISTNSVRPLQGQSPYVGNVSLAWLPESGDVEATLLYNVFGERISQVGANGRPDTYEQPFKQLDFTMSAKLPWDGWKMKLRLKNILDPEATFTVGDQVARRYSKGREVALSIEWRL